MGLPSEEMASFAGAYDFFCVGHSGGLVEALSKSTSDQGPWRRVVTTNSAVDVFQQSLPLFDGDAALQDPRDAPFAEFLADKEKPPRLSLVWGRTQRVR